MLTATVTVDDAHRVRLLEEVRAEVEWIIDGSVHDCIIVPGAIGGVQIVHEGSAIAKDRASFLSQIRSAPPAKAEESHSAWLNYSRLVSACWDITIDATGRFKIPSDVGAIGLLNRDAGATLVIYAAGEILEIWNPSDFLSHLHQNRAWWKLGDRSALLINRLSELAPPASPAPTTDQQKA